MTTKSTITTTGSKRLLRNAFLKAYQQLEEVRESSRCLTGLIEIALNKHLMKLEFKSQ
jgi:hypothetical protein